jgi:uncharacterized protein (DUF1697 family)
MRPPSRRGAAQSPRYVAFLRAINIGNRIVKMDALKAMFEAMRFADVATFIASGNVVFSGSGNAARLEGTIAKGLEKALGYPVPTFVRTIDEVGRIAAFVPFPGASNGTLYVGLLPSAPNAGRSDLGALETATDRLRVHGREVYWLCATGMMQSTVTYARVEKALGLPATFRNISTMRRLAAKYPTL